MTSVWEYILRLREAFMLVLYAYVFFYFALCIKYVHFNEKLNKYR